jgi:prophage regulatory protein
MSKLAQKLLNRFEQLSDESFIRLAQLVPDVIPASKPSIYRWMSEGKFPRPYSLSDRSVGWKVGEIRAWMNSRKATASQG